MPQLSRHGSSTPCHSTSNTYIAAAALLLSSCLPLTAASVFPSSHELYKFDYHPAGPSHQSAKRGLTKRENPIPLIITNNCGDTIWPGIATQHGEGAESNGFELPAGKTRNMTVGPTWQGRIWGRTNCTTSGANTATCKTGDCFGKMECEFSVSQRLYIPITVAGKTDTPLGSHSSHTR